ncbi:nucleoid-associated protein [Chryseolinea lacunae]|uniref:Nucleoid-associated protein n=1 Tax=Chryseolinea lacunae TaxID=2801331 RepID=A0ABS1KRQ4_9BACT|nr:nucleoid-associated protein [Chryseolinea lacunae]MBL0742139.1 nucleoid-associated protein [Chryseolinea lacunae]
MIDRSQSSILQVSVHIVGNRGAQELLKLSEEPLDVDDEKIQSLLLTYFLSNFTTPEYHNFTFSNEDFTLNPLFQFARDVFHEGESFHENSVNIAKHLYEATQHPNIKSGDLYVARLSGVVIDNQVVDALGIFKSENKESYLKLRTLPGDFYINADEGVNIRKLDKGCLILNQEEEGGYKILIVDNANKSDAQFWKHDFLNVKPWSDAFHHTHNFMNLTRQYVGDQLDEEFSVSKADKIDLLNKSINFFKSKEQFNQSEFEVEVLGDADVIESFRKYERTFMTDNEIVDNFEISAQAVKRQARVFKTVLKLDKNFHIYIHGNRELIEKGYDEVMRKHYYKIYFDEES